MTLSSALIGYGFGVIRWRGPEQRVHAGDRDDADPVRGPADSAVHPVPKFGWLNTFYPLIVPFFFGVPIYIFLFRQFFMRMP